jgi:hypothetical protein
MLTKMKIALALCGSLAAGGIAAAQGFHGGAGRAEMISKFDTNKDGKLDDGEKAAMKDTLATERFKKLDTNGDGVLSVDEFKAGQKMGMRHGRGRFHHGLRSRGASKL